MVMAQIYVKCGEYDKALDKLEELLSLETGFTVNDFKLDRTLAPLHDIPRYRQMMQKYANDIGV